MQDPEKTEARPSFAPYTRRDRAHILARVENEAAAHFEAFIEHPQHIAIQGVDQDGVFLHWNTASTSLYGVSAAEAIGKRFQALLSDRDAVQSFEQLLSQSWNTGQTIAPQEWRVYTQGGEDRWVYSSMFPLLVQGRVVEVLCVGVDITARRRAEQALREAEERFSILVEHTSEAILILQNGQIVYRNPACEQLLGSTGEEVQVVAQQFVECVAPEDRERLAAYYDKQLRGEAVPEQYDADLLTADGQRITVGIKPHTIDYCGQPATIVLMRDSTACKRAEEALRESENRYRHLIESSEGLIYAHDLDGAVLFMNPAATQALGYSSGEWVEKNLREFLVPSGRHLGDEYLERIRQQPTDSGLIRVVATDGTERIWLYHNARSEAAERPPYVLSYAQDITEHVQVDTPQVGLDLFGHASHSELFSYAIKLALDNQKIQGERQQVLAELRHSQEELCTYIAEVKQATSELEDAKRTLDVLARHIEQTRKETAEQIAMNMRALLVPILERLRKDEHLDMYGSQLAILVGYIDGLVSTTLPHSPEVTALSSRELQIATMIRSGMADEEIAIHLYISPTTVKTHRRNIRKKLHLSGTEKNLSTYLKTIEGSSN